MLTIRNIDYRIWRGFFRLQIADVILISIGMMFLSDAATTFLQYFQSPFSRVSLVVRLGLEIIYIVLLLARLRETFRFFIGAAILTLCFSVSLVTGGLIFPDYAWGENLIIFNKLLWLFMSWYVLKTYIQNPQKQRTLFLIYEGIIFIQSMSIFLGFLFKIPAFASYEAYRFGYKGLLPAQNETSFFYIIAFFYCALQVSRYQRCRLLLLITTVAAAMTGTKLGFSIPILLIVFVVFIWGIRPSKSTWSIIAGMSLVALVVLMNWQVIYDRVVPTIVYYSSRAEQGRSMVYLITSGRIDLFSHASEYVQKYSFLALIGGYNTAGQFIEMDPVDIFLSIGLLGTIFYYYWLFILIVWPIRLNLQLFFFAILVTASTVAGHFSYSAINGIYCAILMMLFHSLDKVIIWNIRTPRIGS